EQRQTSVLDLRMRSLPNHQNEIPRYARNDRAPEQRQTPVLHLRMRSLPNHQSEIPRYARNDRAPEQRQTPRLRLRVVARFREKPAESLKNGDSPLPAQNGKAKGSARHSPSRSSSSPAKSHATG